MLLRKKKSFFFIINCLLNGLNKRANFAAFYEQKVLLNEKKKVPLNENKKYVWLNTKCAQKVLLWKYKCGDKCVSCGVCEWEQNLENENKNCRNENKNWENANKKHLKRETKLKLVLLRAVCHDLIEQWFSEITSVPRLTVHLFIAWATYHEAAKCVFHSWLTQLINQKLCLNLKILE